MRLNRYEFSTEAASSRITCTIICRSQILTGRWLAARRSRWTILRRWFGWRRKQKRAAKRFAHLLSHKGVLQMQVGFTSPPVPLSASREGGSVDKIGLLKPPDRHISGEVEASC